MRERDLSSSEMLVLTSMARDPLLTDRERGGELAVNANTVATIRKRLLSRDWVRPINIPHPAFLESELLAVIYTDFNPAIPDTTRLATTAVHIDSVEEIFFAVAEGHRGFSLSLSPNFTEIARVNNERVHLYAKKDFIESTPPNVVLFPLQLSRLVRFFDFFPLLNHKFEAGMEPREHAYKEPERTMSELSANELLVYHSLIQKPGVSDAVAAKGLPVTRRTVSNFRKRFLDEGLYEPIYYPNLRKLGFRILALAHTQFNPKRPFLTEKGEAEASVWDSAVFSAAGAYDQINISVHMTYDGFQYRMNQLSARYKEMGLIADMPTARVHTVGNMKVTKDLVLAPLVKKLAGELG